MNIIARSAIITCLAALYLLLSAPVFSQENSKSIHIDQSSDGGRLSGELKRADNGFVFNGTVDLTSYNSNPTFRFQLFFVLYKDNKQVDSIYVPVKKINNSYIIKNFAFSTAKQFDAIGWRVQYNCRLE